MKRILSPVIDSLARAGRRLLPDPEEDALYVGLGLLAAGLLLADLASLALIVPGAILVGSGLLITLAKLRRNG
jgi:hypothetical protein